MAVKLMGAEVRRKEDPRLMTGASTYTGDISLPGLCHVVFVVLGATSLARLLDAGVPYLLALPLAGLILVPVGALVAIPAIRLSGLFLALATFGFGVLAQNLIYPTHAAFGGEAPAAAAARGRGRVPA